jgi:hypothetical protein
MLILGMVHVPSFDVTRMLFDASSVVHSRSSLWSIHDVLISRLLTVTFTTAAFRTEAAYGCLKPTPTSRLRRAFLHLRHSTVFREHVLGTMNLSIGRTNRLIARWSCSTMLLRYLIWRSPMPALCSVSCSALWLSIAAVWAPLRSIVVFSGVPSCHLVWRSAGSQLWRQSCPRPGALVHKELTSSSYPSGSWSI